MGAEHIRSISRHNQIVIGDFAVNTNDLFVDQSTDRVGIQTATPAVPLHIASLTTNAEAIRLDDGVDSCGIFLVDADPNGSVTGTAGSLAIDYTNGKLHVCSSDGTTWDDLSTGLFTGFEVAAQAAQGTDVAHGAGTLAGDVDIRGAVNQVNIQRESATLATVGLAEAIEIETVASRDNTSNIIDLDTGTNGISVTSDENIDLTPTGDVDITAGSLVLLDTDASTDGVIFKGSDRFLHNFHHPTGSSAVPLGLNTFLGINCGNLSVGSTATATWQGSYNTGIGELCLEDLTTGAFNTSTGQNSSANITSGYDNCSFGQGSLNSLTTGYGNSFYGRNSGNKCTGDNNSGFGFASLSTLTSGDLNAAIGKNSGRYITGGSTSNETSSSSVYVGAETKASVDGNTNEIVVGYNAVGNGSNTTTLGHTTVTEAHIRGKLFLEDNTAAADTNSPTVINTPTGVAAAQAGWLEVDINGTASYIQFWQ